MKNLKAIAFALIIMISCASFASTGKTEPKKISNSQEIARLLEDPSLIIEKDYLGKVIFSVNEEKEIVLHAILCEDEFVRVYVNKKLADKVLSGGQWKVGQVYQLPVKMKILK